jgi:hypothetical protein
VSQSIEQAPKWVRELVSPPDEVARMRDLVRRYLAGDTTTGIGSWDELEARLEAADRGPSV